MTRIGCRLLEQLLGADVGYRGVRTGCPAGHQAQFVSCRAKTIDTVLGPVTVRRAYYQCAECGHGVVPKDAELGIENASMSPGVRKMAARTATAVPFATAAGLLAELAGVGLTVKRVERAAEADGAAAFALLGAEADAICSRQLVPLPPAPGPDMLYIAVDGTGVPMVPAATQDRAGKAGDGRARTREAKMACLFTQTITDDDGFPVRDPGSSSYLATFDPASRFGQLVDAEARRRGSEQIRQLVVLGDGAVWIWNLASELFPHATQIVDLYHAREHVHELANLAARLLAGHRDEWLATRLAELDACKSPPCSPLATACASSARWPMNATKPLATSKPTPTGCATSTSAPWACSSAPALSKQAANTSSASASSYRACAGTSPAPPASPPCAARKPATAGKKSGSGRTTRPGQPGRQSENASTLRTRRQHQATRQSPTKLAHTPAPDGCTDGLPRARPAVHR